MPCGRHHWDMAYGKEALGKIFISHSSVDKAWVRRFEKRLRAEGYDTWLDEKEIEVGDALAAKISDALRDAKIVVVVVSASSLASEWLRYELDIATERMIGGHCRLLPVLIDDVDVPPELEGRLYADMRPGRRGGFAKVLRALESEAARYPEPASPPTMDSDDAWVRSQAYEDFLGALADGGWFTASMEISAIRDINFQGIRIGDRDVIVDVVSIYSMRDELDERDYVDWEERVRNEISETCGMLISEKPLSEKLAERLNVEERIGVEATSAVFQPSGALVLVDLSEEVTDEHARDILRRACRRVKDAVDSATPALVDPASIPHDD